MNKTLLFAATLALAAAPAGAQRAVALEGGVLAHYTKFDSKTWLDNGAGLGVNLDAYILPRLALEYSGDLAKNTSKPTNTDLTVVNHRFDLVYNQPLTGKWRALLGGGWTGTKFNGDKTNNEYDSGLNALVGLRYCASDDWNWKVEGVADFKDPSDQAPSFTRTQTYTLRFGLSRFFGGQAKNGP
ncbi:MAG: outer membrane beta-barrel protein, partial [Gemmatimonadota bacterium]|nr:outer membrane beta-barrel protein [Gemmatimonadota bacterium]